MNKRRGRIFVLSSPSGAGKTTIAKRILSRTRSVVRSVSCTTREPRGKERHKRDYFFVSPEEFMAIKRRNGFLEDASVFGKRYGTPRGFVEKNLKRGKHVLLVIDVQGAMKVKRKVKEAILVFIMPPSIKELKRRLTSRSQDKAQVIQRRLKVATSEIARKKFYDHVIVNRDFRKAAGELIRIIESA